MKLAILFTFFIQIGFSKQVESPYEDKFYCMRDGEIIESKEKVLILSPNDQYFYKKVGLAYPTGIWP